MQREKKWLFILVTVFCVCFESFADENKALSIEEAALEKQISYALGYDIFDRLKENFEIDPEFFIMGAMDSHAGQLKVTEEKLREFIVSYQRVVRQKQIEKIKLESKENRANGVKFLGENSQKQGVVTLASGLQYRVMVQGNGPLPKDTDTVECHYRGTLIDGTVFDSSYQRGNPAVFQVNGVIQGWIEALQMMKVGSKWELVIPPELAYGDRGAGDIIKPGSTLVFEIDLLGIVE